MLSKDQLIDQILSLNPSAEPDWLSQFRIDALESYLRHLHFMQEPRRRSRWVRPGDTPAIVTAPPVAA